MADIDPKNIEAVAKAFGTTSKKLEEAIKLAKLFGSTVEKSSKKVIRNLDENIKHLSDFTNEIDEGTGKVRSLSKSIAKLHLKDALDTDQASKLNSELGKLQKKLVDQYKKIPEGTTLWKVQREEIKKIEKGIDQVEKEIKQSEMAAMSFGEAMEKSGPSFIKRMLSSQKGVSEEIGGWGTLFSKTGTNLGKMPGLLKLTGKAAKGLGSVLGGVSKMFAGWPGLVFMAVKKMWDIGMEADQFVKDANQAFARLRGPDITGDVKKQFKEFNDQIFKTGDNLRTGLDVTQIRSLMETMVQAGYNITQLNKGLLGYRDAIYIAAKASATLGLELPQVGSIMGKLFTDLRMNLDEMDKAFVQVGFNAKKSGLSTDRFWNTVANASAHLALYGVVIGSASKTLKRFTEDMIGGADDAEEAVTDMYDVFKKGSLENQAAILDMVRSTKGGTEAIKKAFEEVAGKKGRKALELKGKIELLEAQDKSPKVLEELKKTRAELYSVQAQQTEAQEAAKKNSIIQAAQMGLLADEVPDLLMRAIKGMTGVKDMTQLTGDRMWVAIKSAAEMGVSEKTVRMLTREAQATKNRLEDLALTSDVYLEDIANLSDENKKILSDTIGVISDINATEEDQISAGNKLIELFSENLGMNESMASDFVDILKAGDANSKKIGDLIKSGDEKSLKELGGLLTSSDVLNQLINTRFKSQDKTEGEMADSAEDTFKGIVGQTLSYKEMLEIAKDEIKWRASSLGVFQALNTGVMNIFGYLVRNDSKYMSESQKQAQELIKRTIATEGSMEDLKSLVGKGNISQKDQVELTKRLEKKMAETEATISKGKAIAGMIGKAIAAEDPIKAIGKEIGKLEAKKGLSPEEKTYNEKNIAALYKVQKELYDAKNMQNNLQNLTDKLVNGDEDALKELENMAKTQKDEELKPVLDKILELAKLDPKDAKKKGKLTAEIGEITTKKLISLDTANEKMLTTASEQKNLQDDMKKNLVELNKSNNTVATFARLQLRSSSEYMKELRKEVEALGPKTVEEYFKASEQLGIGLEDIKKAYEAAGKEVPPTLLTAIEESKRGGRIGGAMTGLMESSVPEKRKVKKAKETTEQGLIKPEIVKSPGPVILHPGEQILPKSYMDIKTIPAPEPITPAGGAMGGGAMGRTPIEINVTATEKDLAQKVANEVRRVIAEYHIPF